MKQIGSLFKDRPAPKKDRRTERGELLRYFQDKINPARRATGRKPLPIAAIAVKVSHLSIQDLYFLKSTCDRAQQRGYPWSAIFWKEITPNENQS
jgi:hypothetical protein